METLIKTRIGTTTTVSISFANLPAGCAPAAAILDSSKARKSVKTLGNGITQTAGSTGKYTMTITPAESMSLGVGTFFIALGYSDAAKANIAVGRDMIQLTIEESVLGRYLAG